MNRKLFLSMLLVFISAVSLFGSQGASAQVTLAWTPYQAGPFQVYPGGSTADNVFVLKATGPDSWSGMTITITGPNASSFAQDGNVTPGCFSGQKQCAWGIYFAAPTTPAAPYTATATLTATYTDTVTNKTGSATYNLVANVLVPPTPSGSPNLSFVPPTTIFAGNKTFGYSGNGGPANVAALSAPGDIVFDTAGNAYIADKQNYVVRKVDTSGIITVYAGTPHVGGDGNYTGEGGPATSATLQGPVSLALDKAGNLYFGDGFTAVRVVNAATQKITTYAGGTTYAYGYSGDGGPATSALLYFDDSLAVDSKGNLYILETGSNDIRKVDTNGIISTFAGKNSFNNFNAVTPNFEGSSGDGGPAASATFYRPTAIAIDASDNIYVADGGDRVRKIDATTTTITTVAGIGAASPYQSAAQTGTESTPALQAELYGGSVTLDSTGNIFIADSIPAANVGGPILKVDSTGTVTQYPSTSSAGYGGYLRTDKTGALYVMDQVTSTIYKVGAQGALAYGNVNVGSTSTAQFLTLQNNGSSPIVFNTTPYTIAGNFAIGNSGTCSFSAPLAVGANCTVAVTFSPQSPGPLTGTITFASNSATNPLVANLTGTGLGPALIPKAVLSTPLPFGIQTINTTSNAQVITLSNPGTGPLTISSIALGGDNQAGFGLNASACPISPATLAINGSCNISVNFTPTTATTFTATLTVTDNATAGTTQSVTLTGTGIAAVARVAQLQFFPAQLNLFAGTYPSGCGDTGNGGPATQAGLCAVGSVAVDAVGNTYVVDQSENTVRKVDISGNISTFAGAPVLSNAGTFSGDGGPATTAGLSQPIDVAVDALGNVYISDYENGRIREVSATTGKISTFVGGASGFFNGGTGGGVALGPTGITFDPFGNLYIADDNQQIIVKVTPSGAASLFAGEVSPQGPGIVGYNGDNILAINAELSFPTAVASDAAGNIYIADNGNCRIRKVTVATGIITTVAGNGTCDNTGDNGPATSAAIRADSVALNLAGDILFSNGVTIRKVDINGNITTIAGGGTASGTYGIPATESAFNGGVNLSRLDNNGNLLMPVRSSGYQVVKAGPNGALDFGSSVVGTPTVAQTVTFENTGNTTLTLSQTTYTATGDFAITGGTCTGLATLAPGITCNLAVVFTPTTTGSRTGAINVASNSSSGAQTIFLTGNGTPAAALPTATLSQGSDFGSVTDGTTSAPQTFTLFNTSSVALSNISISFSGENPNSFSETTTCQSTLAANSNCNIFVTFSPALATAYSAMLTVTDNASPTTQTAPLTGTGAAAIVLPPSTGELQFYPAVLGVYAGTGSKPPQCNDTGDGGPANLAALCHPYATAQDSAGNTYIVDTDDNVVKKVDTSNNITTFAGKESLQGSYSGDGGLAINAGLNQPSAVAVDLTGNVYIADSGNGRIREVSAGVITTFVGGAAGSFNTGTSGTGVALIAPGGLVFDNSGNLYIAVAGQQIVGKVTPAGLASIYAGVIQSSGVGVAGYNGDNIAATAADLNNPQQVAIDKQGNIYIADTSNNRVRMVNVTNGIITTVAGNGTNGDTGDGGLATSAEIGAVGVAVDPAFDIYVTDGATVRKVNAATGNISTLAGTGAPATQTLGGIGLLSFDNTGDVLVPTGGTSPTVFAIGSTGILTFGSETVGSTTTAQTITLYNVGGVPLDFQNTTFTSSLSDYAVTGGTCRSQEGPTNAGCTITVTFTPTTAGPRNGTIGIYTNGNPGNNAILLQGTGVAVTTAPVIGFAPSPLAFGNVTALTSSTLTLTVSNTGNATLQLGGIALGGANPAAFARTGGTCDAAVSTSCTIIYTFTPPSVGSFSATVTFTDNAADSPQVVTLTGTGIAAPAPIASLTAIAAFPSTSVGATATAIPLTLSNTGNAPLTISSVTITGTNPTAFADTSACGTSLAANSTCIISVTFTPASIAGFSATLTVTDNSAVTTQTATLTGTGIAAAIDYTVTATNPTQTVTSGQVAQFNINVNAVSGSYNTPVVLSVTGLPAGATASFAPASVTPGSTGATTVLSVHTQSLTSALRSDSRNAPWLTALLLLPLLGTRKLRRKLTRASLLAILALGATAAITGCGGGYFAAQSQTVTLTVTGTSGTLTHSTTVTLTIQ